jgi:hypothetical protein
MTVDEHMKISDEIYSSQPIILKTFMVLTKQPNMDGAYLDSLFRLMSAIWLIVRDSQNIGIQITDDDFERYSDNDFKLMKFLENEEENYDAIIQSEMMATTTKNMFALVNLVVMDDNCPMETHEKSRILFYLFSLVKCLTNLL